MTKSHSIFLAVLLTFVSATAYAVPDECLPRELRPVDEFRSFTNLTEYQQEIEHDVNVPVFMVHEQTLPELLYYGLIQVNQSASDALMLATQEQVSRVHSRGALGISALRVSEGEISNIHYEGEAILIVASRAESDQELFVQSSDFYFMPGDFSIHMDDAPVWMGVSPVLAFMEPSGGLPIGGDKNCACNTSMGWTTPIATRALQLSGMPRNPDPSILDPCLAPGPFPQPDPPEPDYLASFHEALTNQGFTVVDSTDVLHDRILSLEFDECRQRDYLVDIYGRPVTGMVDAGAYYNTLIEKEFFIEGNVAYEEWPEPVSAEKCNVTDECDGVQGGGDCGDDSSIEKTPIQKDCAEGRFSLDPLCEVIAGSQGVDCPNFSDYEKNQRDQCMGVYGYSGIGGGVLGAFFGPSSCPDEYGLEDLWCDQAIVGPSDSCLEPGHEPPQSQARHQQLYDLKLIALVQGIRSI